MESDCIIRIPWMAWRYCKGRRIRSGGDGRCFLGGAIYHVPVVIDGVIAAAAAAAAGRIAPAATDYMLAAHVSAEPASIWLLDLIGVTPAIQAGLRLGEGTGALALFPLLDMALSIYRDMDTFAEMEIEEYKPLV